MLAYPRLSVALVLAGALAQVQPAQFHGFREPLARRLQALPGCAQRAVQAQEFGVPRPVAARRRDRC